MTKSKNLWTELIKVSSSKNVSVAKNEWSVINFYKSDTPKTCLCWHFPIINICVIANWVNNNSEEIWSDCVKQFLENDEPDKIFGDLAKYQDEDSVWPSERLLEHARQKRLITTESFSFASQNRLKRKPLSQRQKAWADDIKKQIVDSFSRSNG